MVVLVSCRRHVGGRPHLGLGDLSTNCVETPEQRRVDLDTTICRDGFDSEGDELEVQGDSEGGLTVSLVPC